MYDIDFKELLDSLKEAENVQVKEIINHVDGVLRESDVIVSPYTIKIQYIEFGRHQKPLIFSAHKENEESIHFTGVDKMVDLLGIQLKYKDIDLGDVTEVLKVYTPGTLTNPQINP